MSLTEDEEGVAELDPLVDLLVDIAARRHVDDLQHDPVLLKRIPELLGHQPGEVGAQLGAQ